MGVPVLFLAEAPADIQHPPLTGELASSFFKKYFIYLFLEREEGREKRGSETSMYDCLLHAPYWEPGLQPAFRHSSGLSLPLLQLMSSAVEMSCLC